MYGPHSTGKREPCQGDAARREPRAPSRPTFLPVVALNSLMLVSIPSEGGHYLVDVFGGVAVGIVALLAMRLLPGRLPVFAPARID